MADLPHYPDNSDDTRAKSDAGSPPSTPRWVRVSGIIAIVLALLFIVLHLAGGGLGSHAH